MACSLIDRKRKKQYRKGRKKERKRRKGKKYIRKENVRNRLMHYLLYQHCCDDSRLSSLWNHFPLMKTYDKCSSIASTQFLLSHLTPNLTYLPAGVLTWKSPEHCMKQNKIE